MSFMPHLLNTSYFRRVWFMVALYAVGPGAVVGALLGYSLLSAGPLRMLLTGLAGGYLLFGVVFDYHIHTHDYYQLQLLVIVSLALGPMLAHLIESAKGQGFSSVQGAALLVTLPIMLLMVHYDLQAEQTRVHFETRATAEEIGELTAHSSQVVYLARFYGRPVEYLGEFSGAYWPRAVDSSIYNTGSTRPLSIEERLRMLPFTPTHFVISDFAEFQRNHSDLKSFLREECALVEENERYLIYSDCFS